MNASTPFPRQCRGVSGGICEGPLHSICRKLRMLSTRPGCGKPRLLGSTLAALPRSCHPSPPSKLSPPLGRVRQPSRGKLLRESGRTRGHSSPIGNPSDPAQCSEGYRLIANASPTTLSERFVDCSARSAGTGGWVFRCRRRRLGTPYGQADVQRGQPQLGGAPTRSGRSGHMGQWIRCWRPPRLSMGAVAARGRGGLSRQSIVAATPVLHRHRARSANRG